MRDALDYLMVFLSTIGNNGMIWIAITIGLLLNKKTRKTGLYGLVALLLSAIAQEVLKEWFQRPRPQVDPALLLIEMPESYSFPSGHTLIAFCYAAVIYVFMPRLGISLLGLAALIGISRVYLGVHYFSDVLFGAVIALILAYLIVRFPQWTRAWRRSTIERM